jgi:hypothetical protein
LGPTAAAAMPEAKRYIFSMNLIAADETLID